jgi:hypothetical protein
MTLYLVDHTIKSKVERLFKGLARMLYKERMAWDMHLDFRHLVFNGMSHVVEDEIDFYVHYSVVECAELIQLGINALRELGISIEVQGLNLYVHVDSDLVIKKEKGNSGAIGFTVLERKSYNSISTKASWET